MERLIDQYRRRCLEAFDKEWNKVNALPKGYEMKITPQPWISVLKELPPTDEPVLACWSRQKIGMGCAVFRNLHGKYCWTASDDLWTECDEPIAWMPLPEPPDCE